MTNSIQVVKGTDAVVALIGSIGVKQADYRSNVSSAILSAVAHSIEHNETSLVTKLLTEIFTVSYRDLPVVRKFIESITPIVVESKTEGRLTNVVVSGKQFIKNNFEREGLKQKEITETQVKLTKQHAAREETFANFVNNLPVKVRNLEYIDDVKTPDIDKTVETVFNCDVFAWFEEIEYVRKKVAQKKEADKDVSFDVTLTPKIASLLKAFEAVPVANRNPEFVADLDALQSIATRFAARVEAENAAKQAKMEAAELAAAKAAIFSGASTNLTEAQQNEACEHLRGKGVEPAKDNLFNAAELLAGYRELIGAKTPRAKRTTK